MKNENLKEDIKKYCLRKDGNINVRCNDKSWWKNRNLNSLLENIIKVSENLEDFSLCERIRFILNDRYTYYKCLECGKDLKDPKGKLKFCSSKCSANNKTTNSKRKKTIQEKYGYEYISQVPEIRKQIDENRGRINRIPENAMKFLNDIENLKNLHHNKKQTILEITNTFNKKFSTNIHYGAIKDYFIANGIQILYNKSNTSISEIEIRDYVETLYGEVLNNVKNIIPPYELDIFIPEKRIGIEFNGVYFHSEIFKNPNYHKEKTDRCIENNIRLYQIFENEWNDIRTQEIWKSILNPTKTRIFARNCEIRRIDNKNSKDFLYENHLQGYVNSSVCYGLYYENELMSLMSFGKSRFNKNYEWEILRFCSKLNISIVGGASKLFKHFLKNHEVNSCISYADKRFSFGEVYKILGFNKISETSPNYWYWKKSNGTFIESRYKFQKHKLSKILENFDSNLSEHENMKNHGYYRIYDCGNSIWVYGK